MRFLYCSDLHGNLYQYEDLVNLAFENDIHTLLIGGDLLFKGGKSYFNPPVLRNFSVEKTIECRNDYFLKFVYEPFLKSKFLDLDERNRIFCIFGNADFHQNYEDFKSLHPRFHLILSGIVPLTRTINLLCYSCVPLSHHRLKDFERFDFSNSVPNRRRVLKGYVSFDHERIDRIGLVKKRESFDKDYGKGITHVKIPTSCAPKFSIESELTELFKTYHKEDEDDKQYIWLVHTPPYRTVDMCKNGKYIGSKCVEQFVGKYKPLLVLCGHVHENFALTKKFSCEMKHNRLTDSNKAKGNKKTIVISSANMPSKKEVSAILIQIDEETWNVDFKRLFKDRKIQ